MSEEEEGQSARVGEKAFDESTEVGAKLDVLTERERKGVAWKAYLPLCVEMFMKTHFTEDGRYTLGRPSDMGQEEVVGENFLTVRSQPR